MREALGLDARELSPGLVDRITCLAAETRSFHRAEIVLQKFGHAVSDNTVQRVTGDVGHELAERRDASAGTDKALAARPEKPPALAVVECDGGRFRMREPGHGRGVHRSGEGWRETKNACLISASYRTFDHDPQPEPPDCFLDPKHVAKIAETEALSVAAPAAANPPTDEALATPDDREETNDWRPKRLVRTVVASVKCAREFGRQMAREAKRRRFFEGVARVFLGDGLPWNWTIWKEHFRDFTPVLDFIHPLSYLFLAAKAVHLASPDNAWSQYVAWMRGCWQGKVGQVIDEMSAWQTKLGAPPDKCPTTDSRQIVASTITYLTNNRERMNYPAYRQAGLPITTAWMESLVKEMNYRVKGTEMFWNDPDGGEPILQVRAAALSDDDRLSRHIRTRLGCHFTCRPKPPNLQEKLDAETSKS
ncbi:MAG TPA: hypothetical protein VND64_33135 [Pirellulales bacterium]|nr:hypothetical protein [Pirellulales bacterium]